MGVSVYTDHLIANLGLSRIDISTAYMIGTLSSSLIMTRAGIFYDRFGARITAAGSALFLGLFLILLSQSLRITEIISTLSGMPVKASAFGFMIFGFLGIRFFGQGVLTLVSRGMVMRWFEARRGFASALMGIVTSFGFSYAPRFLQTLINMSSWDGSWKILGLTLMALIVPFILIVFRDSPEDCSMEMEQGVKIPTGKAKKNNSPARSYTLEEARRDPQLWFYMAALFFWALYNTAFTFHITSIFGSLGMNATEAVAIFLPISVISVIGRFTGSWVSDLVKMKYLFYSFTIATFGAGLAIALPWNGFSALLLIGGMGLASGIFGVLTTVTWPKLYGREHLGAISGMAMSFMVAGSALGPWIFSFMESIWGHYRYTGWFGMGFALLIALTSLPVLMKSERGDSLSEVVERG